MPYPHTHTDTGAAAIQPPLRQLLVQDHTKVVVTCNDQPVNINNHDPTCDTIGLDNEVIGHDPEPQHLEKCPQNIVLQRTIDKIMDVQPLDVQRHL